MSEKKTTTSPEEMESLKKDGYVVTSVSYFEENGKPTYTLEKDSDWSKKFNKG